MEAYKVLTQKFKTQSLEEEEPLQQPEGHDRDSGTESDEENAELLAIEEAMQSSRDRRNFQPEISPPGSAHSTMSSPVPSPGCDSSPASPVPSPSCDSSPASPIPSPVCHQLSIGADTSPCKITFAARCHQSPAQPSPSLITSSSNQPFLPVHLPGLPQSRDFSYITHLERDSPTDCSDFDRCSLDYEPDGLGDLDPRSSDDELAIINRNSHHLIPEKRKWSQVKRCNSCDDYSESSDDEIREIFMEPKPLKFGSAPPKGIQRLSHTMSPALFLANISAKNMRLCCVSPRKRHRQMTSADSSDATVMQRPYLDFEKMQLHWLPHNNTFRRRSIHR